MAVTSALKKLYLLDRKNYVPLGPRCPPAKNNKAGGIADGPHGCPSRPKRPAAPLSDILRIQHTGAPLAVTVGPVPGRNTGLSGSTDTAGRACIYIIITYHIPVVYKYKYLYYVDTSGIGESCLISLASPRGQPA